MDSQNQIHRNNQPTTVNTAGLSTVTQAWLFITNHYILMMILLNVKTNYSNLYQLLPSTLSTVSIKTAAIR